MPRNAGGPIAFVAVIIAVLVFAFLRNQNLAELSLIPFRIRFDQPNHACTDRKGDKAKETSNFKVGMEIEVEQTDHKSNNLRVRPDETSKIINNFEPGPKFYIYRGPNCGKEYRYWGAVSSDVEPPEGNVPVGWMAEGDKERDWIKKQ